MGKSFEPCIPTRGIRCADRPEWIQKIKNDGRRLIIQREATRVRLFARKGHDWSDRFLLITAVALRNRNSSFVIDGEAVRKFAPYRGWITRATFTEACYCAPTIWGLT